MADDDRDPLLAADRTLFKGSRFTVQGAVACEDGTPLNANPYRAGSAEHECWAWGWRTPS